MCSKTRHNCYPAPMASERSGGNPPSGIPVLTATEEVEKLLLSGHSVRVRVQGQSMTPEIPDGAVLTFDPVTLTTTLRLGDIALYKSAGGNRFTCHRILSRRASQTTVHFGFRGDACTAPLEWVESSRIIGKAVEQNGQPFSTPRRRWKGFLRARARGLIATALLLLRTQRRRLSRPTPGTPSPVP